MLNNYDTDNQRNSKNQKPPSYATRSEETFVLVKFTKKTTRASYLILTTVSSKRECRVARGERKHQVGESSGKY